MPMSIRYRAVSVVVTLLAICAGRSAYAGIPVPAGLSPGDDYQLLFNSSVATDALSSDINFYNDLVQAAADAAGIGSSEGVTWRAIASTATIDARVNAAVGVSTPVFNLREGQFERLADGFNDLWDGTLDSAAVYDEFGQLNLGDAWTGSLANGLRATGSTLGHASGMAWCGRPSLTDDRWLTFLQPSTLAQLSVYGLSEAIMVTDADFNQDQLVNGRDFLAWQRGVGGPASLSNGDANGDGTVDGVDLAIWQQSFGNGINGNVGVAAAVPEPTATRLVALGFLATLVGQRRLGSLGVRADQR